MISVNQVFQYSDSDNTTRIRVIALTDYFVYAVNLEKDAVAPQRYDIDKFNELVANNEIFLIMDPNVKVIDEFSLTKTQKEIRDRNWTIIHDIWVKKREELLSKSTRNRIIKEIAEKEGLSEISLKRMISRFWQRGMNKNAVLPDYINSGGKGKNKKSEKSKLGRPKQYSRAVGINVDESIKNQFAYVIKKYYLKSNKISLRDTYSHLLKEFYCQKYFENGIEKYVVMNEDVIPSYDQFYYWYQKQKDIKSEVELRISNKRYELQHRPLLSSSTVETDGPGTRFQIDATIGDIYLVSTIDGNLIIGRPVIYAVFDVYSRLAVGVYIGLEGPSWLGALMALDNMISDKVEFCAKYGITINSQQWPAQHLPEILLADRGEFEGYNVEGLINNFNIKIENTSPYRGDLKGIVERKFRTTNERIKKMLPGAIQSEYRERSEKDYRLKAKMNLNQFTRVIINLLLEHNEKTINEYPLDKRMIVEQLAPTPINLWNWGIQNRKGQLQYVTDSHLFRLNILPKGQATITRKGIKFKGLQYSCERAIAEQWYVKYKSKSIDVVYDPRDMQFIYILHSDNSSFDICFMLETDNQYKLDSLEEIEFFKSLAQHTKKSVQLHEEQTKINTNSTIDAILKETKTIPNQDTISNAQRVKGIKKNRSNEKQAIRDKEKFTFNNANESDSYVAHENKVVSFPHVDISVDDKQQENKNESSRLMNLIKKKRDERFEKQ